MTQGEPLVHPPGETARAEIANEARKLVLGIFAVVMGLAVGLIVVAAAIDYAMLTGPSHASYRRILGRTEMRAVIFFAFGGFSIILRMVLLDTMRPTVAEREAEARISLAKINVWISGLTPILIGILGIGLWAVATTLTVKTFFGFGD